MFERCLYFNLNALTRKVNRLWDEAFRHAGLSPSNAYLMRVVLNEPGITQKRISETLELAPSTVTRFVDTLVKQGLLERRQGIADSRESTLFPTPAGEALHAHLQTIGNTLYQHMRELLSQDKFDLLVNEAREAQRKLKNPA
ncbi:MAG: MarR family transcriptional regulator [Sulfuricellaceae bacterium]|nr:MarR family transcriptional regulator [Sulfuricellaceae bacterium]